MFNFVVSLLYPKKCVKCGVRGTFVCDNCFATISFLEYQFCAVCQKGSIDGLTHPYCRTNAGIEGILSAIAYKGIVKKLLYQFKYAPYLSALKNDLGRLLYEGLIQQEAFIHLIEESDVMITCVPLHKSRLRERGYNQSELLACDLAQKLNCVYMPLLVRTVNTKPQFDLKKEQRSKNILNAFSLSKRYEQVVIGKKIIVVDDILTTGSTLRECAKVLKKSGAVSVLGVTLAHEIK